MRGARVVALGLAGLLVAAALALGALRLVGDDLGEPSDVDAFPALTDASAAATPTATVSPSSDVTPTVAPPATSTATPSGSPSPTASRSPRPSGLDDGHDRTGDDD